MGGGRAARLLTFESGERMSSELRAALWRQLFGEEERPDGGGGLSLLVDESALFLRLRVRRRRLERDAADQLWAALK